jgi:hypothetical protein
MSAAFDRRSIEERMSAFGTEDDEKQNIKKKVFRQVAERLIW